jgi:glutamate N-acetyltransferase/amino-acid N-acetyltransferase
MDAQVSLLIPRGFRSAAVKAGIKPSGNLDLALLVCETGAAAAGVFTTNRVAAAPVKWDRMLIPGEGFRAVVVNAGNANAATGAQGDADVQATAARAAEHLRCRPEQILIASTGVIGRPLPLDQLLDGVDRAAAALSTEPSAFALAAQAIMTTDTVPKIVSLERMIDDAPVRLLGLGKGAAMIAPNLATMLVFLLTDARVTPGVLQGILASAAEISFNQLTIDGDQSTNDTVLLLASGEKDRPALAGGAIRAFSAMVTEACIELARQMAADGEGSTKRITVTVSGAVDQDQAQRLARGIASSLLVKTAIHGADPNWGRILAAAGAAGVPFTEGHVSLRLQETLVYEHGAPTAFDASALSQAIRSARDVSIHLDLAGPGHATATVWSCDLTAEYVRLNAEYTT